MSSEIENTNNDDIQLMREADDEKDPKKCCSCKKGFKKCCCSCQKDSTKTKCCSCCKCNPKKTCKERIISCLKFECCRKKPENVYVDDNEWDETIEQNLNYLPPGFKDWLYTTFKKRNSLGTRARVKSRSVARTSKSTISLSKGKNKSKIGTLPTIDVLQLLKTFDNWDFDVFYLHQVSKNHALRFVILETFNKYGINRKFNISSYVLDNFIDAMEHGYTLHKNPYHNDIHSADIVHNMHFLLSTGISRYFTDLEIFAIIFAAIIHDFEHNGRTNNFHIETQSDLAVLYNDRSVLENHHLSSAFRILKNKDCNIISDLTSLEFHDFRHLVIEAVLATDMSEHFQLIKVIKAFLREGKWIGTVEKAIGTTLSFLLHSADIANPGKSWDIHKKWVDLIMEEYFVQGDEERKRGFPMSPLCDRNSVIPEVQVTFIELIVEPTLTLVGELIDMLLRSDFDDTIIMSAKNRNKGRGEGKKISFLQPSSPAPEEKKPSLTYPRESRAFGGSFSFSLPFAKPILTEREARIHRESISVAYQPPVKPWVPKLIWNKGRWKQMTVAKKKSSQNPRSAKTSSGSARQSSGSARQSSGSARPSSGSARPSTGSPRPSSSTPAKYSMSNNGKNSIVKRISQRISITSNKAKISIIKNDTKQSS